MNQPSSSAVRAGLMLGLCGLSLAAGILGCQFGSGDDQSKALRESQQENTRLKADLQAARERLAAQERQIDTLQGLGEKRLDMLFHVARIDLTNYTGGQDLDGAAGDDGIRVYLRPLDRDGHPIKAAGSVRIQLFELGAEAEDHLLAVHDFPVEKIAEHWASGFMTYHYRFDCPWRDRVPKTTEVTVRAVFTDYLTGRQFTAQRLCQVSLPGATQPAK